MRDGDHRAGVFVQEVLQPLDRFGVEMVRRLVEQEQVRVLEEQPGQGHPALLAARERPHVGVVRRAAQGVHRDLDVPLDVPGVGRVDPVLERALLQADRLVVGGRVGPTRHHGAVLVEQRLDFVNAVHDVALHVLGRVELRLLAEVADGEARRQAGLAGEPVVEAGHDPQEARLPGTVRADDPDLGAREERDRDVLEDRPVGRVVAGKLVGAVDEFRWHDRPSVAARSRWWRRSPGLRREHAVHADGRRAINAPAGTRG